MVNNRVETRDLAFPVGFEGQDGKKLVGWIARYMVESHRMMDPLVVKDQPFVERIAAGAFVQSLLRYPDVPALVNHNKQAVLGRTSSGTLTLSNDEVGLAFSLDIPETGLGRDSREMVRRGDVRGCSFGMIVLDDVIEARSGGPMLRTVTNALLTEVSPLCYEPAYQESSVEIRERQTTWAGGVQYPGLARARRLLLLEEG